MFAGIRGKIEMGDTSMDELRGWFAGRIPDDWFTGALDVTVDREEILVIGDLADVQAVNGASEDEAAAANESRIDAFREDTRAARMHIAEEAQRRFDRQVSWGVRLGGPISPGLIHCIQGTSRWRPDSRPTPRTSWST